MTNPIDTADMMRSRADVMNEMASELNSLMASVTTELPGNAETEMDASHTTGYRQVTLTVTARLPKLKGDEHKMLEDSRWDNATLSNIRGGEGYKIRLKTRLRLNDFR